MGKGWRKIQRRKKALKKLDELMSNPEYVVVTHYSCESFYDRLDGSSPRITSIAVANLESAQTDSFSIHQIAEREKISLDELAIHYDHLEKLMLDEFYEYARAHSGFTWLHWNMRNVHYGFQALNHRYKVLGGQPAEIPKTQLVDLSRLLHAIYGEQYIDHPHLQKLIEKNQISDKDFLTGKEESIAFENREYVKLHFSTLRKVCILASIAKYTDEESLATNSTWWDIYGAYPQAVGEWLGGHWLAQIIGAVFAIIGFIATMIQIWEWIFT